MSAIEQLHRLLHHAVWADDKLLSALRALPNPPANAAREFAHILATADVWLSRMEGRAASIAIWPTLDIAGLETLARDVRTSYDAFFGRLAEADLDRKASYVNSAGQHFETPIGEILLHVALHAQYHRGKVNLMLRQAGEEPVPTDYIAFVRGVPAARS
jgi:uncharacterized damage-inducible protein DinB